MKKAKKKYLLSAVATAMSLAVCVGCSAPISQSSTASDTSAVKFTTTTMEDGWVKIENEGGATLGYSPNSKVQILTVDGYQFKDLNKNGKLDVYEDWREDVDKRAKDLASQMEIEEIAGLMLYSAHTALNAAELTEDQQKFLQDDNVRAVLITQVASKGVAAQWNNNAQAFVEATRLGIPINSSSDPRNSVSSAEAYKSGDGEISMWPSNLGMAATFNPAIVKQFGDTASQEYRALGISTALSPQIDLSTEPRWLRVAGTYGEGVDLAVAMTRAYVDGFQTTEGSKDGWGNTSVNAMIKHWPGDGAGEKGRESHLYSGKYAVYPGGNFATHLLPFTEGGFKLDGPTGAASALMTSYSIAYDKEEAYGELVGSGYSKYKVQELLRDKYNYDGVVCTDWMITGSMGVTDNLTPEKDGLYQPTIDKLFKGYGISWGTEYNYTVPQRFYKILQAGCDQFGGVNTSEPVIAAYKLGVEDVGEAAMRARFEESAVRLLKNVFRPGLFENPYLNVKETEGTVGKAEFMKAGYEAQLASVVMLKNSDNLVAKNDGQRKTVYVPQVYHPAVMGLDPAAGGMVEKEPAAITPVLNIEAVQQYFDVVTDTVEQKGEAPQPTDIIKNTDFSKVDFGLVAIDGPSFGSVFAPTYLQVDKMNYNPANGAINNGYYPISLQYRPYTAPDNEYTHTTIATDPVEEEFWIAAGGKAGTSRSYAGKTTATANESDLDLVLDTQRAIGKLPLVVFVRAHGPQCFYEFEKASDALFVGFGVSDQAILEVISGKYEPEGLLPIQMPKDMATVEANKEDTPGDLDVYVDANGNAYDYGYGLNWSGPIADQRTKTYQVKS